MFELFKSFRGLSYENKCAALLFFQESIEKDRLIQEKSGKHAQEEEVTWAKLAEAGMVNPEKPKRPGRQPDPNSVQSIVKAFLTGKEEAVLRATIRDEVASKRPDMSPKQIESNLNACKGIEKNYGLWKLAQ